MQAKIILLLSILVFLMMSEYTRAPVDDTPRIVVENADYEFSPFLSPSIELDSRAEDMLPRVVMLYPDCCSTYSLHMLGELEDRAKNISPRIAMLYADYCSTTNLHMSEELEEVLSIIFVREDINKDGVVDISDLLAVGAHLGENPPTNPRADVNNDGNVDILDMVLVARCIKG